MRPGPVRERLPPCAASALLGIEPSNCIIARCLPPVSLRVRALTCVNLETSPVGKKKTRNKPAAPVPAQSGWFDGPVDRYIYLTLLFVTLAVYSQTAHFGFVNYDDPDYVVNNVHVREGFTRQGVIWAFTSFYASNWSPLTWLSHMADCQVFGLRSGWHHRTSVLLHAAAALLLFSALKRLTGARWPSAFVAFLFALHPLHVESVAWVAERKDVLCALFWFLALWCYARYTEQPGVWRYLAVLAAFVLGLMAKPMIVTLPFVLLLLDYWPLGRLRRKAVLWEKAPFLVLAAGSAVVTFFAQQQGRAVRSLTTVPLGLRIGNALVTYGRYLVRTFWPTNLAVCYPYQPKVPEGQTATALIALVLITALVVRAARSRPYLVTGWFWYLGTLVPVIGLVQVGAQSSADRYMYVPMVGVAIMLAWGGADLVKQWPDARTAVAVSAAAGCALCALLTAIQLSYWADSGRLFEHAIAVTTDNHIAHNNLANYYLVNNRNQEAAPHIYQALRIKPTYPEAHVNLALLLRRLGKLDESEREYRVALNLQPASAEAHSGYGALLIIEGRINEAAREFSAAAALRPNDADTHYNLGRVLGALGRQDEAAAQFYAAGRLRPEDAAAHRSLAFGLLSRGRLEEAVAEFRLEAAANPGDAGVHTDLGSLLSTLGRWDEAIDQFSQALRINPNLAGARRGLEKAQNQRDHAERP